MSLDRALQLNTAAMAVLGAVFVGLGRDDPFMPGLLAVAAATAVALTDILGWWRMNRLIANLLAVAAVAWSLRDFFKLASDAQLQAIASMLVYLQIVLLFQEKTARVYWQLLVLTLLEVVVAAALDLGPQFGLLLGIYFVLALISLVLLCIYRDARGNAAAQGHAGPYSPGPGRGALRRGLALHGGPAWQQLRAPPTVWPLTLTSDELARGLAPGIIGRHVAALWAATLLFTVVFFYATPRLSDGSWMGQRGRAGAISGIPPEVRLEESGWIHLGHQVVMRVALTRLGDRQPVELVGEPYFHGSALTEYVADERGSRWVARSPILQGRWPSRSLFPPLTANMVRQDIVLEAAHAPRLFAIMPVLRISNDTPPELRYDRYLQRLAPREPDAPLASRQFRYAFATPAIRNNRQVRAIPHYNPVRSDVDQSLLEAELDELRTFDAERFPVLAATAARMLREQEADDGTQLDKALALERHFRAPGLYQYSLNLDFTRHADLDPVEDFVAHHRTGHCEYFASALVLMLRSQGIPARLVTGYKGGDFNSLGRYYAVQQQHAHTWVEAWMPPDEVAEWKWELAGPPSGGGAWYRLDPTPASRDSFAASDERSLGRHLTHAFDYLELLWRDYVLSLNAARQQDTFYDPLTAQAAALPGWLEGRSLQRSLHRWLARLGVDSPGPREGGPRAFEAALALVVAGGIFLLLGLTQAVRYGWGTVRRWLGREGAAVVAHPPGFYLRLERLLRRLGLRRRRGQTARELAAEAERRLAGGDRQGAVSHLPAEIVAAYYRVRFAGDRLDKKETDAIEQALAALVPAVNQARKR